MVRTQVSFGRRLSIIPRSSRLLFLGLASLAVASGCAHGGVREGVYHAPANRYQIDLPHGRWDQLSVKGSDLVLTSADKGMTILTGSLCGKYANAKLNVLSRNLFIGLGNRQVIASEPVELPAGEGERIRVNADLEGSRFCVEAYTFRREPCVFDFVYLAVPEYFEVNLETFRSMMKTLRFSGKKQK